MMRLTKFVVLGGLIITAILVCGTTTSIRAGEPCTSCSDCQAKLTSGLFTHVELAADITEHEGVCIGLNFGESNLTFDCNGYLIDGDGVDSNPDQAVLIRHGSDITITNCLISDFSTGIFMVDTTNNTVSNNLFYSNRIAIEVTHAESNLICENTISHSSTGIKISDSNYNQLDSNFICDNEIWDIYFANGKENIGEGNTCEKTSFWVEGESPGCTFACPFFVDGFESGCCGAWVDLPTTGLMVPTNWLN